MYLTSTFGGQLTSANSGQEHGFFKSVYRKQFSSYFFRSIGTNSTGNVSVLRILPFLFSSKYKT